MKRFLCLAVCFLPLFAAAQANGTTIKWLRETAISPDGQWIAFEYKGNIFKVPATGGNAIPLTITPDYEGFPVWSHDGKYIAFASDRHGNFDVYVMPSDGGNAVRLTYNAAADIPYDFTPDDKYVVFGTARNDFYTSVRFPLQGLFPELYRVPVTGGRSVLVNDAGMATAKYNADGHKIIFEDVKGYESPERKHERASVTRDIWVYDLATGDYTQLTHFNGNDLSPVWGKGNVYYYTSERDDNDLNVYQASLDDPGNPTELTHFKRNPVRSLSISSTGVLCFTHGGNIYTLVPGQEPQEANIVLQADFAEQATKTLAVSNKDISEMTLSPDGKEVAFVYRGDIFVSSADGKITKRLTSTPYQERMIRFSPNGRHLVYSVEKDSSWDVYQLSIAHKNEPFFYAATVVSDTPVIATPKDEFQPVYSPDGEKIAYLEERNVLKVYNLKTQKTVTVIPYGVNYSYSDGDQYYTWSPDSKWILANSGEGTFQRSEIDLIRADGTGGRVDLTQSGFDNETPKWAMDGKAMMWQTSREGMKNPSRGSQSDVYIMFFDKKAFDQFNLSKEDLEIQKAEKKDTASVTPEPVTPDAKTKKRKGKNPKPEVKSNQEKNVLQFDLNDLDSRTKRLTINSSLLSDYILSKDGETLYYLAKYEGGYNLWTTDTRTHDTKILAPLNSPSGGSLAIDTAGKVLFVLAGGKISSIDISKGTATPLPIRADFNWDPAGEREYIFEHAWKQVTKKLFDPKLQGVDWNYYHDFYRQFLPYINNDHDFRDLLSEMLGELDVSHTGAYYRPHPDNPDETASLGMLYNDTLGGNGVQVEEVITGGPMDNGKTKVRKGDILEKIDGIQITGNFDWAKLLNHQAGVYTRLSFLNPGTGKSWDEVIKPIPAGEERGLMYKRWVHTMQAMTDSFSHGQIGYIHVQAMNDPSFRTVINKVLGKNWDKKALIVDTRFNGGGWLHDDLAAFLSGKLYLKFAPQGQVVPGGGSMNRWTKPSCVLMSQSNYSDAFIFPYVYKELGIGKLIGMPVPGTGTAVWWETQIDQDIIFGIPMIATQGIGQDHFTENHELEPDIKVPDPYNRILNGKDPQLEAAVKEMLKEIGE